MRDITRGLAAGLVGAIVVWATFWLEESVLPGVEIYLPLAVGRLLIVGGVLAATRLLARRWPTLIAGSTLAGGGIGWALHEMDPLVLCRLDLVYRPCTTAEISWMVVPAVVLIILAGVVAAVALRRPRVADPA